MNDDTPPKRVTRARAAAKTHTDTAPKTTKIATAASKAKVSRSASTTKRKTRTDDVHEDEQENEPEEIIEPEPRPTRGRQKKAAEPEPEVEEEAPAPAKSVRGRSKKPIEPEPEMEQEVPAPAKSTRGKKVAQPLPEVEDEAPAPAKSTRGHSKKAAQPEPEPEIEEAPAPPKSTRGRPKKAVIETPAPEPSRPTRGRAKKTEVPEEEAIVVEEPPKRAARTGTATVTKAAPPKKTVKFEEPDKENIAPVSATEKAKAKVAEIATGLRAKPVRKPATTTRATRGRAKTISEEAVVKSSPLSPKKATQVATARDLGSDDELAKNEKTPMKPLMKSPMKPPGSVFGTAKKLDFSNSITVNRVSVNQDFKGSVMGSPARRPPQSPFKESMKASPQRVPLGGSMLQSPFKPSLPAPKSAPANSPFKASLLQSPARRPQSPTKVDEAGSPTRSGNSNSLFNATPKVSTFKISRFATPRTITKSAVRPGQMLPPSLPDNSLTGSPSVCHDTSDATMTTDSSLKFSGRLSSIMPRETDPAFVTSEAIAEETEVQPLEEVDTIGEPMAVDQTDFIVVEDPMDSQSTTPPVSPPRNSTGAFDLRQTDENPFQDSDSEDELASGSPKYSPVPLTGFKIFSHDFASSPASPTPFAAISKTPRTATTSRSERNLKIGFTPLARQLSDWMAASPERSESVASDAEQTPTATNGLINAEMAGAAQPSPSKSTYFDDAMSVHDEMAVVPEPLSIEAEIIESFEPVELDEEDLALAHEADEMSLLEPDQIEPSASADMFSTEEVEQIMPAEPEIAIEEPAPSEASQEYGDENAIPIDPALFTIQVPQSQAVSTFTTPKRVLAERTFHTVSKVPLKPAAEDSPMRASPPKRSASISRLPVQRPTERLSRNNTVISYSPTKSTPRATPKQSSEDVVMQDMISTPSKPEMTTWSTMGTPARTPRRDVNPALLKGAVVFVDVHTTEGADASILFTELLTQMGARCVKRWDWNGKGEEGTKIGITHVVFKDGGKRTLEKARESGGVVSCVGVGWVLE
jgi:hypothetical protein